MIKEYYLAILSLSSIFSNLKHLSEVWRVINFSVFVGWGGMEGVLPTFTAQNKFVIWSVSAKEEKWRCSGWLVGTTMHLRRSMHHVPGQSN